MTKKEKGKKKERKEKKKKTRLLSRDIVSKVNPREITTFIRRRLKTAKQLLPWIRLERSEERAPLFKGIVRRECFQRWGRRRRRRESGEANNGAH